MARGRGFRKPQFLGLFLATIAIFNDVHPVCSFGELPGAAA